MSEAMRTNKQVKTTFNIGKYIFAIGFFFFAAPGTVLPGQFYAKLLSIQIYKFVYLGTGMLQTTDSANKYQISENTSQSSQV